VVVSLRYLLYGTFSLILLCSCSFVETPPTPYEWGTRAGEYASDDWVEKNGTESYPRAETIASYCVEISFKGQEEFGWTFKESYESTEACTAAFSKGLGLD
jgi:hypothetical protein